MKMNKLTKDLMRLLDEIDNLDDADLSKKRFGIFEKYGFTVTFKEDKYSILNNMN